jgi:putative redox protein
MKAEIKFTGKSAFETSIRNHKFMMDTQVAAGGDNLGPSPKEMMLASIIGCSGMDVAAILKKNKMDDAYSLVIRGDAEPRKDHPRVFIAIHVTFEATGKNLSAEVLNDAVHQSLTKFCGVSAMVYKVSPIHYSVILNGSEVGKGTADFQI